MSNLIAIVGRPNVGKSALFNRIVGKRIAIVHDQPGVTRDRISAEAEWRGKSFTLVDTGGIGLLRREKSEDILTKAALEQVELAIDAANVILLVVNAQEGIVPLDKEVAQRLRKCGKPIFVAANKVDNERFEATISDFAELGFEKVFPVSAIHGRGVEELMDAACAFIPKKEEPTAEETAASEANPSLVTAHSALKLAIVGKPNVGKSSIINALTKSSRVIVSPIPGTTRDAVDVPFEVETDGQRESYILIDTAGIRKHQGNIDSIEFYSVKRSEESIERSDITILVIDAEAGITEQEKKIGGKIVEAKRACIVVVNKWDLMAEAVHEARKKEIVRRDKKENERDKPKEMTTLIEFGTWVQDNLFFLDYAPVIFVSAHSGFNLNRLLEAVRYVAAQLKQKIPTSILNRTLHDAVERRQPVSSMGHRLKFFYATQVQQSPPTFVLFVNKNELFSDQYKKYLAGEMRKAFGYEGCPIILAPKARPKTIEPVRKKRFGHKTVKRTKVFDNRVVRSGEQRGENQR